MRPEIHGHIDEAEDFQLHAGSSHQVHCVAMKAIAAQGILKKMHFHSRPSALCQRFGKCIRYLAFFEEEVFECDGVSCGMYRLKQSRKYLLTIFQRGHLVAFQQGWAEQISHRPDEDIVPDCVVGANFVMQFLLGREEIARDKERRRSANGGRAEHFRPSWRARRILHARVSDSAPDWRSQT